MAATAIYGIKWIGGLVGVASLFSQRRGIQNAQDAGTTGQEMGASNFSDLAAPPQQIGASNFSDLAAPPQILNIPHLHNDQSTYGGISSILQTLIGVGVSWFQKAGYNKVSRNNENNESVSTISPQPDSEFEAGNNGKENKRVDEDKSESTTCSRGKRNGDDSDEDDVSEDCDEDDVSEDSDESNENNDGTDDEGWYKLFKELVRNAIKKKKYKGKFYYKIKENGKDIWISIDKTGHAGSRYKVYSDKKSNIKFENNELESTTSSAPASDVGNNGKVNKRLDEDKSESSLRSGGKGNGDDSDENEESDDSDESGENNDESVGDTDVDDWKFFFTELVRNATEKKKYKGKFYYKIKENGKDIWISKDKAGHAGSRIKVYSDKKSYIEFDGSRDARFKPIHGEHESRAGTIIRKSEMDGIPMRKKPNSILYKRVVN